MNRLLQPYEAIVMEIDDPKFRERLTGAKDARRAAQEKLESAKAAKCTGSPSITPARIRKLAEAMNAAMRNAEPALRKAYLRLFVDRIVIADKDIGITGPTAGIERTAAQQGQDASPAMVPSFVRDWYPVRDSNSCYRRERAIARPISGHIRTVKTILCQ